MNSCPSSPFFPAMPFISDLSGEAWENASDQFAMLVLNLIGLENGASFPDQSRSGVEIILLFCCRLITPVHTATTSRRISDAKVWKLTNQGISFSDSNK